MFGSSLIVFRETLEAALLIGIIAAATKGLLGRNRWLSLGVALGLFGSIAVALSTESIANLFDGIGQDIFNASILGIAVLMLGWHNVWMASHGAEMASKARQVGANIRGGQQELSTIAIVVALAVLREGSETALFLHGIAASSDAGASTVLLGGLSGLLAGVVFGIIIYAGLLRIPLRWFFSVTGTLLLLLAAGLASQMARVLIQSNLLPSFGSPLWDSASVLPVTSILGSSLHILIGYDARPSGMQVIFYLTTLVVISAGTAWVRRSKTNQH